MNDDTYDVDAAGYPGGRRAGIWRWTAGEKSFPPSGNGKEVLKKKTGSL